MRLSILNYMARLSDRPTRAEDSVEWQNGSRSVVESGTRITLRRRIIGAAPHLRPADALRARPRLEQLHWRVFGAFDAALFGAFFTQSRDTQVPNLIVDLAKGGFREFVGRHDLFLEPFNARERSIDLIRW